MNADAHIIEFKAIGTIWSITTPRRLNNAVIDSVRQRIELFDQTYSRFRKDSLVWNISQHAGEYDFPDDFVPLISFYKKMYDDTNGKVTPLIGSMLEKAGYDADYSFVPRQQSALPKWQDVLDVDGTRVRLTVPVTLDFGAAGKGYLVDIISEILESSGVDQYVINASGDLRHRGASENRVGLEDPTDPGKVIGVIDVQNQSLCASAINRRQWSGLHHVFDPDTMDSTKDVVATWVIAETTMLADGIATALFFTDPKVLHKDFTFEFARMHSDGSIDFSALFENAIF